MGLCRCRLTSIVVITAVFVALYLLSHLKSSKETHHVVPAYISNNRQQTSKRDNNGLQNIHKIVENSPGVENNKSAPKPVHDEDPRVGQYLKDNYENAGEGMNKISDNSMLREQHVLDSVGQSDASKIYHLQPPEIERRNLEHAIDAAMASTPTPVANAWLDLATTRAPGLHSEATEKFGHDIVVENQKGNTVESVSVNFPPLPTLDHPHYMNSVPNRRHVHVHAKPNVFVARDRRMKDFQNLSKVENMLSDLHIEMQKYRIFQQTGLKKRQRQLPNNFMQKNNRRLNNVRNPNVVGEFMHGSLANQIPHQHFPQRINMQQHFDQRIQSHRQGSSPYGTLPAGNVELESDREVGGPLSSDVVNHKHATNFVAGHTPQHTAANRVLNEHVDSPTSHLTTIPNDMVEGGDLNRDLRYGQMPNGDIEVHNAPILRNSSKHFSPTFSVFERLRRIIGETNNTAREKSTKFAISKDFLKSITNENVSLELVASVSKQHFVKPAEVQTVNEFWQVQNSEVEIFLYSAYFDDRPATDRHSVRIIGIADIKIKEPHCLLWYNRQKEPDAAIATLTKIGPKIHPVEDSEARYESYLFTCNVKKDKPPPEEVSLITVSHTIPTNLLKVQIPEKPSDGEQIEIGQCMSIIYWHQEPTQLVEWIELHKIWGIGEITVYADDLSADSTAIFQHYADEGYVDLRQMPNVIDDDGEYTILMNMSPAINDCMYRNMYRYKRIMCTDVDEMIVPRVANNYTEMLEQILQNEKTSHPHPSFIFRNVYFFSDFEPVEKEPWFLISQRYLKHIKPSPFGYSAKSITDPQACIALQNHLCWKRFQKYDSKRLKWTINVPLRYGRNHHYKKCHFDDFLGQFGACKRLMHENFVDRNIERFGDQLYNNTAIRLVNWKIAQIVDEPNEAR